MTKVVEYRVKYENSHDNHKIFLDNYACWLTKSLWCGEIGGEACVSRKAYLQRAYHF